MTKLALSERLAYILDFDVKSGVRSLEKVGSTAEKELGKAERKLDKISGNLTKFGAGAVAAAGTAGVALFKMGQGAAESEANLSALNQVLGETIAMNLAEWAEDGAEKVGMSERAIYAAATSFGQLGKVAGLAGDELEGFTKRQITLAADMAAFKDVTPDQAIQDLTAAYAGSSETLQKYNVFVNDTNIKQAILDETGKKVTGTLSSQERVMGINLLLMEQTADISGQWARESDGLAGQQAQLSANLQNLSDNIGRGVLPMLTKIVGTGAEVAGTLASMDDATGGAIGRFAALGAGGLALLGTLSLVAGQVIKMRDRFTDLNKDGTRSLNNLGRAAKGVGIAMGVAGVALAAYQVHAQRAAYHTQNVIDKADELGRVADEQLGRVFTDAVLSGTLAGKSLDETMADLARTNIEGSRRMLEHAESTGVSSDATEALRDAIAAEEAAREQQTKTTEKYADAADDATEATDATTEATGRTSDAIRLQDEFIKDVNKTYRDQQTELERTEEAEAELQEQVERTAEAQRKNAERTDEAREAHRKLVDEIRGSMESLFSHEQAVLTTRNAYLDYETALEENMKTQADAEVSDRDKIKSANDLRVEELRLADQVRATAESYAEEQGAVQGSKEWTDLMREALEQQAGEYPHLRDEIDLLIAKLNEIPTMIHTGVTITYTENGRPKTIKAGPGTGTISTSGKRAHGGPVSEGGLYEVTEGGKSELLHEGGKTYLMAGRDGRVEPMDSGGQKWGAVGVAPPNVTYNMTFNGDVTPEKVVDAIKQYERRNGNRWRS